MKIVVKKSVSIAASVTPRHQATPRDYTSSFTCHKHIVQISAAAGRGYQLRETIGFVCLKDGPLGPGQTLFVKHLKFQTKCPV